MHRSAAYFNRQPLAPRDAAKADCLRASPASRSACYSFLSLIVCLALAGLLVGCAQPGQIVAKPATEKRATGLQDETGVQDKAAEKATASAVIWQSADKLLGLGSEDVRAALGAPARIRDEDPARIYQYIGGDCVLDLFLYQAEGIYRVTYAEARSVKAEKKPVEACLKSLPSPVVAANALPDT